MVVGNPVEVHVGVGPPADLRCGDAAAMQSAVIFLLGLICVVRVRAGREIALFHWRGSWLRGLVPAADRRRGGVRIGRCRSKAPGDPVPEQHPQEDRDHDQQHRGQDDRGRQDPVALRSVSRLPRFPSRGGGRRGTPGAPVPVTEPPRCPCGVWIPAGC